MIANGSMQKSKPTTVQVNNRTQILHRLRDLHNYLFIGYLEQLDTGVHLVRLQVKSAVQHSNHIQVENIDFIVTECIDGIRAVSKDGRMSIAKLT